MKNIKIYILLTIFVLFIGCGSSSSENQDIDTESTNNSPIITTTSFSIYENNRNIGKVLASDIDGDDLIFSIISGDDKDRFIIDNSSGELSFNFDTNYSNPLDKNKDNNYEVEIKVSDSNLQNSKLINIIINQTIVNNETIITKLNLLRKQSGMISLKDNAFLNISALNHAKYLDEQDVSGHYETNSSSIYYTAYEPFQRALVAGYKTRKVSENLSVGQESEELSLEGLMSAIYHRFGFLDFEIDEIGYGKLNQTYVYNMGNSYITSLCDDANFTTPGWYNENVCENASFRIEVKKYNDTINILLDKNPSYVIYPFLNQTNISPVFYEESPDPLPNHGVSGYPISIEFNSFDFNISNLTLNSFILKDNNLNSIDLIEHNNSSIMSKLNDPNAHFTNYQFAIFPDKRLDYNTTYHVEVLYTYEGNSFNINWDFKTKELINLIRYNDTNISMELNKEYYIYFAPNDSNDTISNYSISYTYLGTNDVQIVKSLYDKNTLKLKLSGSSLRSVKLILNGPSTTNKEIDINIQ